MSRTAEIDWPSIVFSQTWLKKLNVLASNRFNIGITSESSVTFVIENLSENNWARLNSFTGGAKPETYLHSICTNLLEEFARKQFGRPRPPVWLKNEGETWIKIWKMVCLERQQVGRIIDVLCFNEKRSPDFVHGVIKTIKARLPWCGVKSCAIPVDHLDDCQSESMTLTENLTIEGTLDKRELEDKLNLVAELLDNLGCPSNSLVASVQTGIPAKVSFLKSELSFTEEEILVVKMAYQEGLKLNIIADALSMPRYQPGRLLKKVFKMLFEALNASDIETDGLRTLLAEVEL